MRKSSFSVFFFYFSAYLPSIWQMFSVNNVRDLQSFFGSATSGYLTHILFLVPNLKNNFFSILNCKNFHNIGAKWQLDNFSVTVITLIQFQLKMFSLIQCKRKRVSVVCTSKMYFFFLRKKSWTLDDDEEGPRETIPLSLVSCLPPKNLQLKTNSHTNTLTLTYPLTDTNTHTRTPLFFSSKRKKAELFQTS